MPRRKILLRVLLWSLAIAAVAGVLTVLTQGGTVAWKGIGTASTTAVACGLLLLTSILIDHKKSHWAVMLGTAIVVVEFLLTLVAIWEIPRLLGGYYWPDEIGLTMLWIGVLGILAMCCLAALHTKKGATAGLLGIVVTTAVLLFFLPAIWLPDRSFLLSDWWQTGTAIFIFGGLASLSLIGVGTKDRRHWRWVGVVAAAISCGMWLFEVWVGVGSNLGFVIFATLISIAAVVTHANLILMGSLPQRQRWVQVGTIVVAVLTAVFIDILVIDDRFGGCFDRYESLLGRLAGACGIVTACGTLALCVLVRFNRKVDFESLPSEFSVITVLCPRCGKKQAVDLGEAKCAACGLRILVRVEEPRCPQCEYLLYGTTSDRCPECGLRITTA